MPKKPKFKYGLVTKEHGFYGTAKSRNELNSEVRRLMSKGLDVSYYKIEYPFSTNIDMQKNRKLHKLRT